jgi:hypothetical protein
MTNVQIVQNCLFHTIDNIIQLYNVANNVQIVQNFIFGTIKNYWLILLNKWIIQNANNCTICMNDHVLYNAPKKSARLDCTRNTISYNWASRGVSGGLTVRYQ